jgi:hypothetical protein
MLRSAVRAMLFSAGLLIALVSISFAWPPASVWVSSDSLTRGEVLSRQHEGSGYVLYVPTTASLDRPITLMVAFFGMGGKAEGFASSLAPLAEQNGWLLLVPDFHYGDWQKAEAVQGDDRRQFPWLRSLLDILPRETGLQVRDRILLYGFSRGAQASHRFALMYHDKVLASAVMSAGTYTLPLVCVPTSNDNAPLNYPLGVGDLGSYCGEPFDPEGVRKVAFWVGVGALDSNPADVPHQWDKLIGTNRVDRAGAFVQAMLGIGVHIEMETFPGLGHAESAESRARASAFLRRAEIAYYAGE